MDLQIVKLRTTWECPHRDYRVGIKPKPQANYSRKNAKSPYREMKLGLYITLPLRHWFTPWRCSINVVLLHDFCWEKIALMVLGFIRCWGS